MAETNIEDAFLPPCGFCQEAEGDATDKERHYHFDLDFTICCRFHKALACLWILLNITESPKRGIHFYKRPKIQRANFEEFKWYCQISPGQQMCSEEAILKHCHSNWGDGDKLIEYVNGGKFFPKEPSSK